MSHEAERRGASLPLSAGDASAAGVGARPGAASPRPWRVDSRNLCVLDANGDFVASAPERNAALIVAAVNACDPVVEVHVTAAGASAIEGWARALDARAEDAVPPPLDPLACRRPLDHAPGCRCRDV